MKIDTLVRDVESLLSTGSHDIPDELCEKYGSLFVSLLKSRMKPREPRGTLRMSNIGKPCERQVYYSVNNPEEGEALPPSTLFKFMYGDLIELLMLFLAEASGHSVEGTQDEQEISGIKGHRDAVIDGVVVDVKSASSYSFKKFENHELAENDPFGYSTQLQSYLHAGQTDDKVTDKTRGAFFVADKTLGHLTLDIHPYESQPLEAVYERKKRIMAESEPPVRGFNPIDDGKSGNQKLDTNCSYCSFKKKCHPGLRTFLYSRGPVHLTRVRREPDVPEVT